MLEFLANGVGVRSLPI